MLKRVFNTKNSILSYNNKNKNTIQSNMDIGTYVKLLNANATLREFLLKCELHSSKFPEFKNPEEFLNQLKNLKNVYENVYQNKNCYINKNNHSYLKLLLVFLSAILILQLYLLYKFI